jgi:PAS domain S-box-containing protein
MTSHSEATGPTADSSTVGPTAGFEQAVVDQLYEGVYYVDLGRRIRSWNQGAERLIGFDASDVVGRYCHDNLLNHVDASGQPMCRTLCPLAATMRDGEGREADAFLRHRKGHRVPVWVRGRSRRHCWRPPAQRMTWPGLAERSSR